MKELQTKAMQQNEFIMGLKKRDLIVQHIVPKLRIKEGLYEAVFNSV